MCVPKRVPPSERPPPQQGYWALWLCRKTVPVLECLACQSGEPLHNRRKRWTPVAATGQPLPLRPSRGLGCKPTGSVGGGPLVSVPDCVVCYSQEEVSVMYGVTSRRNGVTTKHTHSIWGLAP